MPKIEDNSSNDSNLATPRISSLMLTSSTPKCDLKTTINSRGENCSSCNNNQIDAKSTLINHNTTYNSGLNIRLFLGEQGKRVRFYRNGDQFFKV